MARTKQYDREETLEKSFRVFWRKGFEGTSISDIEKATGLNTFSMYREFASKEGLFEAAMDSYYHSVLMKMVSRLKQKPGLDAIRDFFDAFPTIVSSKGYTGCLFMNTLAEKNLVKGKVIRKVADFCSELSSLLERSILAAQESGEVDSRKDAKTLANYLVCMIQGLTLYGRVGVDKKMVKGMLDTALTAIEG